MSKTQFIVVRHGETAWNAEGRIQGHLNSPLNDEGLAQAVLVGNRLAHEKFDALYSSDLGRTLQTAQPLVDRTHKPAINEPRLRERHLGVFQGLTGVECERAHPADYARFKTRDPDHVVPEGESVRQMFTRVAGVFNDLAGKHSGQRIVVVTHGGVLDALYRLVNQMPLELPRNFPVFNASLNFVSCENQRWSMKSWGDIAHLTRDAALDDF